MALFNLVASHVSCIGKLHLLLVHPGLIDVWLSKKFGSTAPGHIKTGSYRHIDPLQSHVKVVFDAVSSFHRDHEEQLRDFLTRY